MNPIKTHILRYLIGVFFCVYINSSNPSQVTVSQPSTKYAHTALTTNNRNSALRSLSLAFDQNSLPQSRNTCIAPLHSNQKIDIKKSSLSATIGDLPTYSCNFLRKAFPQKIPHQCHIFSRQSF